MKRRVVVTGMGAVTPVGHNVSETFENLLEGKNGIDFIKLFDTSDMKVKVAGEVKDFDFEKYIDKRDIRRSDRVMLLGLVAAIQAYEDSGLKPEHYDPYRFGTFVTSGIGGLNTIYEETKTVYEKSIDRMSSFFIPNSIINMIGGMISIKFNAKGPNLPIVTACSASTNAIGEAFRYIRDGYLDCAFAGGSEASINKIGVGGFTALRALNQSNDPARASIPFDKERSGFVMGEGAGVVILESYEHAKARGAKILGEVVGYGTTSDAYHMTAPDEHAEGITKAIELAIKDAGIKPEDIGYVNAHGTSTPMNDRIETLGLKKSLGKHAYDVSINSTKSMTGHMLGATGAIESIVCLKSLETGLIAPTIGHQVADPDCDLNYTFDKKVSRDLNYAMNLNVGFGGQNAVLIFKKGE